MPKIKKDQSTYLSHLKFDPQLAKSFIAKYFTNLRLVLLLVFFLVVMGITSYLSLPRNLNPEVKIPLVIVTTILPGAGPSDVEQLVTIPIEDAVQGLAKTKTISSSSLESVSATTIEFESGVDPEKARADVQSAVDGVSNLPSDAQTPKVTKLDFENQPVWSFSISGNDTASLFHFAQNLKTDLENLTSVSSVSVSGVEVQEVQILIRPETISTYHLNPILISQAIKSSLISIPSGNVQTEGSNFTLSIDPGITNVSDIRDLKVNLGQSIVSLGDVATILERSKPEQTSSYVGSNNQPISRAVSFSVFRNTNIPIEKSVQDAQKVVDQKLKGNKDFKLYSVINTGELIGQQFSELQRDILLTVGLVVLILFIFLGARQSLVAALTAPLTFFLTFIVMRGMDISLSFIAIFSLLLSLGLLVDDAIVIISAVTAYFRSGKFTPLQTGLLVWRDFLTPVLTTTITTVWAFIPLLLATGIIGEFIKPIPIIVSSTLLASIFTALFVTFPLMIFLLKPGIPKRVKIFTRIVSSLGVIAVFTFLLPKDNNLVLLEILAFLLFLIIVVQVRKPLWASFSKSFKKKIKPKTWENFQRKLGTGFISLENISFIYKRQILRVLNSKDARRKVLAMVVIFSLFAYFLFPLGLVKNEFFPKEDGDYLFAQIEYPSGTNLDRAKEDTLPVLEKLKENKDLEFVLSDIGKTFSSFGGVGSSGSNSILFSLKLVKKEKRVMNSSDLAQKLRNDFANYDKGKFTVQEVSGGPPAGADVQIKLFGPDLAILDLYAGKIEDYLAQQPGVANVDKSIKSGTSKLTFVPDKQKMAENNLTNDQVGLWMRVFASGFTADKIKLPGDTIKKDINIRLSTQTQKAKDLSSLMIPTANGNLPLLSLGTLKLETNPAQITREEGKRTLSVTASITKGYSATAENAKIQKFADSLNLPSDYSWQTGGINEENTNSVNSIIQAMFLSFVLIITTMVIQFSSFRKALIVILVIPLSIAGVFVIFGLSQTPLSFPALIGVLALFGIVVKNSILVVDKITANSKTGMDFNEAIADGASSRLEPIALTSLAAIIGLIPITLSNALWRGLGGAIISGLVFSGSIMLLFIPVVYYYLFNPKKDRKKN